MQPLKLLALDQEDLSALSAHCQDAVVRVADMEFLPRERRFVLLINRFDWLAAHGDGTDAPNIRRRAALRIEAVREARVQGFDQTAKDQVLALLAVQFLADAEAPSGTMTLVFAGGGSLRLSVEYIEVGLTDLGAAWETKSRPHHGGDDGPDGGDEPADPAGA